MSYKVCFEVSPECPVEASTYGYYPNLPGNAFLLAVFATCAIAQLILGVRAKLRAFTFTMVVGTALEAAGYGGRIIMHSNPWSSPGFKLQIVCLVLAPSFLAAGFYLTVKHLVMFIGPEYSRLKPQRYTWLFIGADVVSICLQAVGGGVAAAEKPALLSTGNGLIVAGIAFQVFTMFICGLSVINFAWRVHKNHISDESKRGTPSHARLADRSFRFYLLASAVAYLFIWVRCIYRIPEMAGGWGGPLMHQEAEFMVLDGTMIALAAILMSVAHPGIWFPQISSRYQHHEMESGSGTDEEKAVSP